MSTMKLTDKNGKDIVIAADNISHFSDTDSIKYRKVYLKNGESFKILDELDDINEKLKLKTTDILVIYPSVTISRSSFAGITRDPSNSNKTMIQFKDGSSLIVNVHIYDIQKGLLKYL